MVFKFEVRNKNDAVTIRCNGSGCSEIQGVFPCRCGLVSHIIDLEPAISIHTFLSSSVKDVRVNRIQLIL